MRARFVEGLAALGLLVGVWFALDHPMARVACASSSNAAGANRALTLCFNRSLVAVVEHYGIPMAVGFLAGAALATVLVLITVGRSRRPRRSSAMRRR
jgi:hypothetical protein